MKPNETLLKVLTNVQQPRITKTITIIYKMLIKMKHHTHTQAHRHTDTQTNNITTTPMNTH